MQHVGRHFLSHNACPMKRGEQMQSDPVNMDNEGHRKCLYQQGFRIKCVEFRENLRHFFPQGQSKRSVMTRCLY